MSRISMLLINIACNIILFSTLLLVTSELRATDWTTETCNDTKGGTIEVVNNVSFCRSKSPMNWWSAFTWCQAMGGYMPTIKELCPNVSITYGASCSGYSKYVWSSTPSEKNNGHQWAIRGSLVVDAWPTPRSISGEQYAYCLR